MPGKSAILSIKILTDARQAQAGLDKASGSVGRMQAGLKKAAIPAGIALAGIVAFGKGAGEAASATEQAMGGIDAVFGKSAGQMKAWAANAAESAGLAKSEYGDLATVIGSQLKNAGLPMDQVASKTNDLIKMGADLAATYGGTTAEAVSALSSALKGEMDPLERYGTSLTQSAVSAQMAADGTDKLTGSAAKTAKANATLALITAQTADATGKFASESDTAAGQQARATASYENAQAALGQALLPAMAAMAGMLATVSKFAAENSAVFTVLIGVIAAIAAGVIILNAAMTVYNVVTTIAASKTAMLWLAALGPIALVIAAIALVVGIVVLLWKRSETFRNVVLGVWGAIKTGAQALGSAIAAVWNRILATVTAVIGWIKRNWQILLAGLAGPLGLAVLLIIRNWDKIRATVGAVLSWIRSQWAGIMDAIKSGASTLGDILTAPFRAMQDAVQSVMDKIGGLLDKIKGIHLPHIPGLSLAAGGAAAAPSAARTAMTPAPSVMGLGALTGRARVAPRAGTTVVIQGAVDPEATARQVRRILDRHDGRIGLRGVLRTS